MLGEFSVIAFKIVFDSTKHWFELLLVKGV